MRGLTKFTLVTGTLVGAMWLYYRWGTRDEPYPYKGARQKMAAADTTNGHIPVRKDWCGHCGHTNEDMPLEPPVGSWVKDRHGIVWQHVVIQDRPGWWNPGTLGLAQWESMWRFRGPLRAVVPFGKETRRPPLTFTPATE